MLLNNLNNDEMENDPTSNKNNGPPSSDEMENDEDDVFEDVDEEYASRLLESETLFESQEFSALDRQLDQLQLALDELESRNSMIHNELMGILHSNRQVRKDIMKENGKCVEESSTKSATEEPDSSENSQSASSTCQDQEHSKRVNDLVEESQNIGQALNSLTDSLKNL